MKEKFLRTLGVKNKNKNSKGSVVTLDTNMETEDQTEKNKEDNKEDQQVFSTVNDRMKTALD